MSSNLKTGGIINQFLINSQSNKRHYVIPYGLLKWWAIFLHILELWNQSFRKLNRFICHYWLVLPHLCPGRTGGWLQLNWPSLKNNWSKLETSGELRIILEESMGEYTSNEESKTGRCPTCNRLDLESRGSWPTMPKHFPGNDRGEPAISFKLTGWSLSRMQENYRSF